MENRKADIRDTSILRCLDEENPFARDDDRDDGIFYSDDRFVDHLDKVALNTVEGIIGQLLDGNTGRVLDLMAGYNSHIPDKLRGAQITGLGMNENELRANGALSEYVIHDLNRDPVLPFQDNTFDAVINTVSVDYMTRPFDVFREVSRVLKPGGIYLVIFSNRYFPEKVVRIWAEAAEKERIELVMEFFKSGCFSGPEVFISMGKPRPADDKYFHRGLPSDPVYAVYARKWTDGKACAASGRIIADDMPEIDPGVVKRNMGDIKNSLKCPYCGERMRKWEVPNDPFVDYSNDYMYICFNDSCPYVVRGWRTMFRQGICGRSYRVMYNPEKDCIITIPISTLNDLRQGIVEE